jgi:hypothetical protein
MAFSCGVVTPPDKSDPDATVASETAAESNRLVGFIRDEIEAGDVKGVGKARLEAER